MEINNKDLEELEICKKIKNSEIIVLSGLKNIDKISKDNPYNKYYSKTKDKKEKTQEELNKIKKLKDESLELYYKLENQKSKELESVFNSLKLKIKFKGIPRILREGMIYTESDNCLIIYESKFFNKLYEIKFE